MTKVEKTMKRLEALSSSKEKKTLKAIGKKAIEKLRGKRNKVKDKKKVEAKTQKEIEENVSMKNEWVEAVVMSSMLARKKLNIGMIDLNEGYQIYFTNSIS